MTSPKIYVQLRTHANTVSLNAQVYIADYNRSVSPRQLWRYRSGSTQSHRIAAINKTSSLDCFTDKITPIVGQTFRLITDIVCQPFVYIASYNAMLDRPT